MKGQNTLTDMKKSIIVNKKAYLTDLLFGIVSGIGEKHYLLADFDAISKEEVLKRIGSILMDKYKFGDCYLVCSGNGWHVVNFSDLMSLEGYVKVLEELGCDMNYIYWIKKVRYGVLRLSRRSSHFKVPYLDGVIVSPYKKEENEVMKGVYFGLLELEQNYKSVRRVLVYKSKKRKEA